MNHTTYGYVYILKDVRGSYYIGSTNNVERRMRQHLTGHTHTTKRMSSPKLAFIQQYDSVKIARSVEAKLKKLKRKDYIAKIISDGFIKIMPS